MTLVQVAGHSASDHGDPDIHVNARPTREVEDATRAARRARTEAQALRALTPAQAVERITPIRAVEVTKRETARMLAERERPLPVVGVSRSSLSHEGPTLG